MDQQYSNQPYGGQSYPQYGGQSGYPQQNPQSPKYESQAQNRPDYPYDADGSHPQYGGQSGYPQQNPQSPPYGFQAQNRPDYPYDADGSQNPQPLFNSISIRNGFVRVVYAIFSLELMAVNKIISLIIFVEFIKTFFIENHFLFWIAIGILVVVILIISFAVAPRRQFPLNVILFAVFTVSEGLLLGIVSIRTETHYILYAVSVILGISIVNMLFALQTKIDYNYLHGGLIIIFVDVLTFGILAIIWRNKILPFVYCAIGVLVISLYRLVGVQVLMTTPENEYNNTPKEYMFAVLSISTDNLHVVRTAVGLLMNR